MALVGRDGSAGQHRLLGDWCGRQSSPPLEAQQQQPGSQQPSLLRFPPRGPCSRQQLPSDVKHFWEVSLAESQPLRPAPLPAPPLVVSPWLWEGGLPAGLHLLIPDPWLLVNSKGLVQVPLRAVSLFKIQSYGDGPLDCLIPSPEAPCLFAAGFQASDRDGCVCSGREFPALSSHRGQAVARVTAGGNRKFCVYSQFKTFL